MASRHDLRWRDEDPRIDDFRSRRRRPEWQFHHRSVSADHGYPESMRQNPQYAREIPIEPSPYSPEPSPWPPSTAYPERYHAVASGERRFSRPYLDGEVERERNRIATSFRPRISARLKPFPDNDRLGPEDAERLHRQRKAKAARASKVESWLPNDEELMRAHTIQLAGPEPLAPKPRTNVHQKVTVKASKAHPERAPQMTGDEDRSNKGLLPTGSRATAWLEELPPIPNGRTSPVPISRRSWSPRPSSAVSSTPTATTFTSHARIPSSTSTSLLGERSYMYSELDGNEFRLVKLLPARRTAVRCEIIHANLANPPQYTALSYAWGDAADTRKIQLEGCSISITSSLHGALAAMRHKTEPILVWADALCINQQNRDERTQQVSMMTEIYSTAQGIAIWLGPEADDSYIASQFLRNIYAFSHEPRRVSKLIASSVDKVDVAATVALFERDYWKRLWVVQEVLNARDIVVYCGSTKLSWETCTMAAETFKRHRPDLEKCFPSGSADGKRKVLESQNQLSYSQVLIHQGPGSLSNLRPVLDLGEASLLRVLRACRRKLAFDPRDKVFGILGILSEDVRGDFRVDYSLSVKEVYTDVVDYLLSTTEKLDVICEAIYFPLYTSSTTFPTWVPDWSHIPQTTALGLVYDFNASDDTKVDFKFRDEQRNKLEIAAIPLDTIHRHGVSVGTLCASADYLMAFLHWRAILFGSDDILQGYKNPVTDTNLQLAFCQTICLDQIPDQWQHNWLQVVYHLFSSLLSDRLPHLPLDPQLASYISADLDIDPEQRRSLLHRYIGVRMMGRCFCLTKDGRLGMGTGFMAPDDVVVVPLGCRTPILLRRAGSRGEYRLVGDVYIHGYMTGRAVKQWREGKREVKRYIIH